MSDTVVLTYIYKEFWGTEKFRESVTKLDLPIHNAMKGTRMVGDGQILKWIYDAYVELKDKYKYAIYSDGADTYFVKNFKVPDGKIIYSAEKAVWPPTDEMRIKWKDYYGDKEVGLWKYLNGGNCCGPIELIIEFFEKYGIADHVGKEVNGQGIMAEAFIKARADGFPIELDTNCEYFQTTGFAEPTDFLILSRGNGWELENLKTHTFPAVWHGNGRTSMDWIYNTYK